MRLVYVLDCAEALAGFWSAALGFRPGGYHPPYLNLSDPDGRWPDLLVPEPKTISSTRCTGNSARAERTPSCATATSSRR